jgi:uncharacterized protein (TIGR02646 family)
MIRINRPSEPQSLAKRKTGKHKGKNILDIATEKIREEYDNGIRDFDFKQSTYASVKEELLSDAIQAGKCCFCEAKLYEKGTNQIQGDVEHFRPKNGYKQDINADAILKPSYYWLAYDWDNLLFACQVCNNRPYKENKFPLIDDSRRAMSHHDDISLEQPYLIHPAQEDPEEHITFSREFIRGITERGRITIEILGLDREGLNDMRREYLPDIVLLAQSLEVIDNEELRNKIQERINYHKSHLAQFSGMIRANFP